MVRAVVDIATPWKHYPSPGLCIYCGRKAVPLTKEHIIAYGLAADSLVFRKASCRKCQDAGRDNETRVLRHMWWPFRAHINAPTRHRGQTPETFTMMRTAPGAVVDGRIPPKPDLVDQIPLNDYPLFYYAFSFKAPGIIADRPPHQDKEEPFFLADMESLKTHVGDKQAIRLGPGNWEAFCLMLAKIAHAYAAAELGVDSFNPSLTLAIQAKAPSRLLYWIGCTDEAFTKPSASLHEIGLRLREIRGARYVAAHIRLFACIGTPTYEIIVGELKPSFDKFSLLEKPIYCIEVKTPLPLGKLVPIVDVTGLTGGEIDKLSEKDAGEIPDGRG